MEEYKINKEVCEKQIYGVCRRCGGKLEPIETVDNSNNPTFWPGCQKCMCFDCGVPVSVFNAAKKLVEERFMNPYSICVEPNDDEITKEYKKRNQIGSVCDTITEVLWAMGIKIKGE